MPSKNERSIYEEDSAYRSRLRRRRSCLRRRLLPDAWGVLRVAQGVLHPEEIGRDEAHEGREPSINGGLPISWGGRERRTEG